MTDIPKFYLETPDGLIYFVAAPLGANVPNGKQGQHLGNSQYLWSVVALGATEPLTSIAYETTVSTPTDEYTLTALDLLGPNTPATITLARYGELSEALQEFYRRTYLRSTEKHEIDVSGHRPLRGDAPPEDLPRNWVPNALVGLYGPQASHLLPGHLSGFRQHMKDMLKAQPGVSDVYDHLDSKSLKFNIRTYWDPPRTTTAGKGRMARTTQTWVTHSIVVPCIDLVGGATLADALIRWDLQAQEILRLMREYSTTTTCGHCNGNGYTTPKKA